MSTLTRRSLSESLSGPARTAVLALGLQSALALAYLLVTDAGIAAPSMLAVPFVWLTVAAVAVRHAPRPTADRRVRLLSAAVGVGYALGLAWLLGMLRPAMGAVGVNVLLLPPGWGPGARLSAAGITLTVLPFRAVGVAALGYLVSLAARDAVDSGLSLGLGGLVALASCAGCALPVLAAIGGVLGGAGLGVGAAVGGGTYLFGTAAYVLAVAVLAGRPLRYSAR